MSENWNDAGCITPSTTTAHPWSKALTHATLYSLCPGKVMWSFMRDLVRIEPPVPKVCRLSMLVTPMNRKLVHTRIVRTQENSKRSSDHCLPLEGEVVEMGVAGLWGSIFLEIRPEPSFRKCLRVSCMCLPMLSP